MVFARRWFVACVIRLSIADTLLLLLLLLLLLPNLLLCSQRTKSIGKSRDLAGRGQRRGSEVIDLLCQAGVTSGLFAATTPSLVCFRHQYIQSFRSKRPIVR